LIKAHGGASMSKIIALTQGKETIVDDEDFEWISKRKWQYGCRGYATGHSTEKNHRKIYLHREIMNAPEGMDVDHINMNPLDNQKKNLRICTRAQNLANRKKQVNNTSGYKGTIWDKTNKNWIARIEVNQKVINIGRFNNPIDAARAYDNKAKDLLGEFANTNFTKGT
jgi:hypothetical protein